MTSTTFATRGTFKGWKLLGHLKNTRSNRTFKLEQSFALRKLCLPLAGEGQKAQAPEEITQEHVLLQAYQAGGWGGAEPAPKTRDGAYQNSHDMQCKAGCHVAY